MVLAFLNGAILLPALLEVVEEELDVVEPLICIARAWKAAKLFGPDSMAFTENTMPSPQWLACRQNAHWGAVWTLLSEQVNASTNIITYIVDEDSECGEARCGS